MIFRELLETLSKHIGQHQIPLNPKVSELHGLVDSGAVHYELVTQIVTAIYTGNHCRCLKDPVTRNATFEALEPIRLALLNSAKTDVDAYTLMDNVCAEVAAIFNVAPPLPSNTKSAVSGGRLYPFRRRLRF